MQLTYRGIPYQFNAVRTETINSEITGKYRGIAYKTKRCAEIPAKPIFAVKYRGVDYMTGVPLRNRETAKNTTVKPAIALSTY